MRGLGAVIPVLCFLAMLSSAEEPVTLTLQVGDTQRSLTLAQLKLKALDVETSDAPIFHGKKTRFKAVPLPSLFKSLSVPGRATIQVTCADGFSSELPAELLLNEDPGKAEALLAIEDPDHRWPTIQHSGETSASGPFYLIWKHPERSGVKPEQWPYQVVALTVKPPLEQRYPNLLPARGVPADHSIRRGFETFVANCFPCHRMNLAGNSEVGPDLNVPLNPTEYLLAKRLRAFIRDPQSLHRWPQGRMPGFTADVISEAALDDLLEYLKHMAPRKAQASSP